MAVVVIAGRKGGVGKSTIAGNLAAEFAAMGQTVAALDADPQHSLVEWAKQGEGMLSQCVEKVEMCDALSRNTPKLAGLQVLLANCLAHGRRQGRSAIRLRSGIH
jgi:chromosome partitioning protein